MSLPELRIRPYRPGDEHGILRTFNLVFREVCGEGYVDRTLEQWRWQYLENPMGHRMSLAVAPDGTIVSQYAGVPVLADTPFGEQRFIHCVDSMSHPQWRAGLKRPGVFVITGLPFSAHSRRIGDAVLYGFPVDAAFRIGARYLEYHFLRDIDFLIRDAKSPPPPPGELALEMVRTVPPDVGSLYERVRHEKRLLLRRDYRYLTWRYVQNPNRGDYELWTARERSGALRGLCVFKPGGGLVPDHATVADWLACEDDAAAHDALLHRVAARTFEAGKQGAVAVFPEWSAEWRAFEARGFVKTPSANWLQRRLVYLLTGSPLSADVLERDWWYALGDSDLA